MLNLCKGHGWLRSSCCQGVCAGCISGSRWLHALPDSSILQYLPADKVLYIVKWILWLCQECWKSWIPETSLFSYSPHPCRNYHDLILIISGIEDKQAGREFIRERSMVASCWVNCGQERDHTSNHIQIVNKTACKELDHV